MSYFPGLGEARWSISDYKPPRSILRAGAPVTRPRVAAAT